jgi:hypothetical protein
MGDATRQNKQMPDTMEMTHPLIQYVKNYAIGKERGFKNFQNLLENYWNGTIL